MISQEATSQQALLFGGSFDPPHRAHVELPRQVARHLGCARIIYMPARVNPHKLDRPPTSSEHRLVMLRLALANVPEAEISTIELDRAGPSYTIDTVETILRDQPDLALRVLLGTDQALRFRTWREWERLLEHVTPAVMLRDLSPDEFRSRLAEHWDADMVETWLGWTVPVDTMTVSGTAIRARLADGHLDPGDFSDLDREVGLYIQHHGLYHAPV